MVMDEFQKQVQLAKDTFLKKETNKEKIKQIESLLKDLEFRYNSFNEVIKSDKNTNDNLFMRIYKQTPDKVLHEILNDVFILSEKISKYDDIDLFIAKTNRMLSQKFTKFDIKACGNKSQAFSNSEIDFLMGWRYCIQAKPKAVLKELMPLIIEYRNNKAIKGTISAFLEDVPSKAKKYAYAQTLKRSINSLTRIRNEIKATRLCFRQAETIEKIDECINSVERFFNFFSKPNASVDRIRTFLKSHKVSQAAIKELIDHFNPH
jgi:hypothetical protein